MVLIVGQGKCIYHTYGVFRQKGLSCTTQLKKCLKDIISGKNLILAPEEVTGMPESKADQSRFCHQCNNHQKYFWQRLLFQPEQDIL